MTAREELHAALDELSDHDVEELLLMVRRMRMIAVWDAAPPDDEEETEEERQAVAQAKAEIAAGQGIPWEEVRRRLNQ